MGKQAVEKHTPCLEMDNQFEDYIFLLLRISSCNLKEEEWKYGSHFMRYTVGNYSICLMKKIYFLQGKKISIKRRLT
jgi:hypothetical protein